jgi:hypothetical protein
MASSTHESERSVNLQSIVQLLGQGPRTDKEIEMICFLGRYSRLSCMRALEKDGVVKRSRTDRKVWQLSPEYLQGVKSLRAALKGDAHGSL